MILWVPHDDDHKFSLGGEPQFPTNILFAARHFEPEGATGGVAVDVAFEVLQMLGRGESIGQMLPCCAGVLRAAMASMVGEQNLGSDQDFQFALALGHFGLAEQRRVEEQKRGLPDGV